MQKSVALILTLFSLIAVKGFAFNSIVLCISDNKHNESEVTMQSTPDWCKLLPEDFKPLAGDKIRQLENMRLQYRATHENMFYSIMSTSWACEMAQYSTLKQIKKQLNGTYQTEKDLWRVILLGRFQTWKGTISLDAKQLNWSADKIKTFSQKIEKLMGSIDEIINKFTSFKDEIGYVLCLEEEAGTFNDPTGILDKVNSILGGHRPSKNDMDWYYSINGDYLSKRNVAFSAAANGND